MRPTVFIGSSTESLHLARAAQASLKDVADCFCWSDLDLFKLNRSVLEWLLNATERFDFAVFIFAPDDILSVGDATYRSVRDNVIFEFGLFLGARDRSRVFAIGPWERDDARTLRRLLDFYGIGLTVYSSGHDVVTGVREACRSVASAIEHEHRKAAAKPRVPLEDVASNVDQIETEVRFLKQRISTQYLGRFPDFFETHIIPSLRKATRTFHIACDFPTYGFFSAQATHLRYMAALRAASTRKDHPVAIHAVFMSGARRREITKLQLPTDWNKAMADPGFAKNLRDFSQQIGKPIRNIDTFEACLNDSHDFRLAAFKDEAERKGIATTCKEADSPMPLYMWITDAKCDQGSAVFSIPQFGDEPSEHGFVTTNPTLAESLLALWQRYVDGW